MSNNRQHSNGDRIREAVSRTRAFRERNPGLDRTRPDPIFRYELLEEDEEDDSDDDDDENVFSEIEEEEGEDEGYVSDEHRQEEDESASESEEGEMQAERPSVWATANTNIQDDSSDDDAMEAIERIVNQRQIVQDPFQNHLFMFANPSTLSSQAQQRTATQEQSLPTQRSTRQRTGRQRRVLLHPPNRQNAEGDDRGDLDPAVNRWRLDGHSQFRRYAR